MCGVKNYSVLKDIIQNLREAALGHPDPDLKSEISIVSFNTRIQEPNGSEKSVAECVTNYGEEASMVMQWTVNPPPMARLVRSQYSPPNWRRKKPIRGLTNLQINQYCLRTASLNSASPKFKRKRI